MHAKSLCTRLLYKQYQRSFYKRVILENIYGLSRKKSMNMQYYNWITSALEDSHLKWSHVRSIRAARVDSCCVWFRLLDVFFEVICNIYHRSLNNSHEIFWFLTQLKKKFESRKKLSKCFEPKTLNKTPFPNNIFSLV